MHIQCTAKKKILFLINAALTGSLADGAELFRQGAVICWKSGCWPPVILKKSWCRVTRRFVALEKADMVFIDIRGGGKALGLCSRILPETKQPVALLLGGSPDLMALLRLGSFSMQQAAEKMGGKKGGPAEPNMARIKRIMKMVETGGNLLPVGKLRHARNWVRIMRYWQHGGPENIKNLLVFAGREYLALSLPKAADPMEFPDFGLFDPLSGNAYTELAQYRRQEGHDPAQLTVGLLFYGGMHFAQSLVPARAFAQELKRLGLNIVPLFSVSGHNHTAIETFFFNQGEPLVDAVVYFQWFQLSAFTGINPRSTIELLNKLQVPVFSACPMYGREISKWEESIQGLSPIEAMTTVILPELDGMIEPIPSAGLVEQERRGCGRYSQAGGCSGGTGGPLLSADQQLGSPAAHGQCGKTGGCDRVR